MPDQMGGMPIQPTPPQASHSPVSGEQMRYHSRANLGGYRLQPLDVIRSMWKPIHQSAGIKPETHTHAHTHTTSAHRQAETKTTALTVSILVNCRGHF